MRQSPILVTGLLLALLLAPLLPAQEFAPAWKPVAGSLLTRWAPDVNPTNCLPEYPRPQLVRAEWLNLNGLWNYALTPLALPAPTDFPGTILVPFPLESALSGVRGQLEETNRIWYQRCFRVPARWAGQRVRLHFGAVDWAARVFVNHQEVGQHQGGYDAFTFDITDQLKWTGEETVQVAVSDPAEADQPHGKQSRKPEGIFYTRTTGIWQTVWLEPVPPLCVEGLHLVPDVEGRRLRIHVDCAHRSEPLSVQIQAFAAGQEAGQVSGPPNQELSLPLANPHLWSPSDPFLYDLRVTLKQGDEAVDAVTSYFGMRKVGLRKDSEGVTRIALNDQFLFQIGTLDQGFWPDGIYTAPTDDALRFDIEYLKHAGFNLARKHVKVEPERWYYWCDRLGLLVWQDMPSGNNTSAEARTQFEVELQRMVEGRGNHPALILWVLFNEGWGQYDTERLVAWLKAADPSRLVDNASGWTDKRVGDLVDVHSYPGPECRLPEPDRASVLGEFGGLGLGLAGHTWSDQFWGYLPMTNATRLKLRYGALLERVHALRNASGLSAAIYTQTTDVETECNGLLTYDRAISKLDPAVLVQANRGNPADVPVRVLAANALYDRVSWRCTTNLPSADWFRPEFPDLAWARAFGGFGTDATPGALAGTRWDTDDLWLRREFSLESGGGRNLQWQVHHAGEVEIYLNGVLAARLAGFAPGYYRTNLTALASATLKPGRNSLAVHAHHSPDAEGQYVDVGMVTESGARW